MPSSSRPTLRLDMPAPAQIGSLARSGAFWSAVLIGGRQLLSLAITAILARILSPGDYGLIGMVATLTALLTVFSDMGLSVATIQHKELTEAQVHKFFWINTAVGAGMWALCAAFSPWVASFYGQAELQNITIALGATFLLGGLAVQPLALLNRSMNFKLLAGVEIGSAALSGVIAIFLAFRGWAYWALIAQSLIAQLARFILAQLATGYRPARPEGNAPVANLLHFGGLLVLNGLLIYVARNLDSVLIGKVWGTEELGIYNRALFLMTLPSMLASGVVGRVMMPSLAALQGDRERFGAVYRKALSVVAWIGCPMAAGLAIVAPEAIRLVYGEKWGAVAPILIWLSIASILQPIYNTYGWLFTAVAKGRAFLLVTFTNAAVLTVAFALSVRQGTIALAATYAITMSFLLTPPALYFAHRAANISLRSTLKALLPIGLATAIMSAVAYLSGLAAEAWGANWLTLLLIKSLSGASAYAAATFWLLRPFLNQEILGPVAGLLANRRAREG